ncbi:MAG TPA: hypothetical protein VL424_21360 [Pararobbsia sp.]|nr:hypothetical protein [Pararobbsia sp.]
MSIIVAGRFDTLDRAEEVAHRLVDDDAVGRDDVNVFYVNPPGQHARYPIGGDRHTDAAMQPGRRSAVVGVVAGVIVGGGIGYGAMHILALNWLAPLIMIAVGAYVGSLIGAMAKARPAHKDTGTPVSSHEVLEPIRESGVMVAVHVTEASEERVEESLRRSGARDVEHAKGNWVNGKWADFDPLAAPLTVH